MRIRLTKEFSFEMAHALKNYDGKCSNIHGHSFKLFVTVIGEPCNDEASYKNGMVIDYGDIKSIVNEHIVDRFDHKLVLNEKSSLIAKLQGDLTSDKIVVTSFQPTSENMLLYFADILKKFMPQGVNLYSLKLYETASSAAEWYADDNKY